MKIRLITVGKLTNPHYHALCEDYLKRLKHYVAIEHMVIKPEKILQQSIAEILSREADRLLEKIAPQDFCIALDTQGRMMDSLAFSAFLQNQMLAGSKSIIFLIGGPHGLGETLFARANQRLSLSPMTFAHELAAAVLLEQLYRAFSILGGEKYHK